MLLVVEGITNSGKTTVAKNLCTLLQKNNSAIFANDLLQQDAVYTGLVSITHPPGNVIGSVTEYYLYLASFSRKVELISRLLGEYDVVVVDRFDLSLLVFFGCVRGISLRYLQDTIEYTMGNMRPDFTAILSVDLDVIISRAVSSPFSRKDIGLADFYDTYVAGQEELATNRYSKFKTYMNNHASKDCALNIYEDLLSSGHCR